MDTAGPRGTAPRPALLRPLLSKRKGPGHCPPGPVPLPRPRPMGSWTVPPGKPRAPPAGVRGLRASPRTSRGHRRHVSLMSIKVALTLPASQEGTQDTGETLSPPPNPARTAGDIQPGAGEGVGPGSDTRSRLGEAVLANGPQGLGRQGQGWRTRWSPESPSVSPLGGSLPTRTQRAEGQGQAWPTEGSEALH